MRQRLSTEIRWQLRRNDFVRGGAGPKENGRFGDVLLPRCHVAILPTAIWFKAGGGVDGSPAASRSARRRWCVKGTFERQGPPGLSPGTGGKHGRVGAAGAQGRRANDGRAEQGSVPHGPAGADRRKPLHVPRVSCVCTRTVQNRTALDNGQTQARVGARSQRDASPAPTSESPEEPSEIRR